MLNKPEFYEKLKTLLNSGISVRRALDILAAREKGPFRKVLEKTRSSIDSGESLADSLESSSGVFTPFETSLIRSGETTGNLEKNLEFLTSYLVRVKTWKRKIITGLIYPFILFHAAVLLPPLSVLIMEGAAPYMKAVAGPLAALYCFFLFFMASRKLVRKSPRISFIFEKALWLVPVCGRIRRNLALSRFLKSLGYSLKAGLNAERALELSSDSSGAGVVQKALRGVRPGTLGEEGLTGVLSRSGLLPGMLIDIVYTGEESGSADDALVYIADELEKDASTLMDRLAIILPVAVYMGVALYIAGIIIRFYGGLYSGIF